MTEAYKEMKEYAKNHGDEVFNNTYLQKVHMMEMNFDELYSLMKSGIKTENYEMCAGIRDIIQQKMATIDRNKSVERLFTEWKTHGKIILALDFDDTVSPWKWTSEEDITRYKKLLALIADCKQVGAYVMVFTACNPERYEHIRSYCLQNGLIIDTINTPPIQGLPYGNHVKPYYNILLDDRAGLDEAIKTLENAMYLMRAQNASERLDYPGAGG